MGQAFADVLDDLLGGHDPVAAVPPRPASGIATQPFFAITPPRPARPRRVLSPRQRLAFETFTALGARIGEDFTRDELRHAYRMLALRYHPDRHPGSSNTTRMAAAFSQLTEAYRRLQTVFAAN